MKIGYNVVTTILDSGILQEFNRTENDIAVENVYRRLLKIADQQTRESLIKLGWTPPPDGGS